MRRAAAVVGLSFSTALALVPASALADELHGSKSEDLEERSRVGVLRVDRGHATLVVQRTLANDGDAIEQAAYTIDLPAGAVATGLRTLGVLNGDYHWWPAELMNADEASALYQERKDPGPAGLRDAALLSWVSQQEVGLELFPIGPGAVKTFEYTLTLPTQYSEGFEHLSLSASEEMPIDLVIEPARPGDLVLVEGAPAGRGKRIRLGADAVEITLERRALSVLGGSLAVVPFGANRLLSHFRVEAAPRLGEVPHGAHVVVLIDTSRSLTGEQVGASVAAARAYIEHFPDGSAEVVLFDRQAKPMHGALVPASQALADLDALVPEQHNGSQIDDALERAAAILDGAPEGSVRRVVALTDLRTRAALTRERVAARLARVGGVVHVGLIEAGAGSLARDDESPWSKPVRATGGLVWQATAEEEDAGLYDIYEEWARPLRVDRFNVVVPGLATVFPPSMLEEGSAFEDLRLSLADVPYVEVTGELWATPVQAMLRPDAGEGRLWSALIFGNAQYLSLGDDDMKVLARHGHAVSPVTSFVSAPYGVRPDDEGQGMLSSGWSGGSYSADTGGGIGSVGTMSGGFDRYAFLRDAIAERCPTAHGAVSFETTVNEVVDVTGVTLDGAPDPVATLCLREAAWALTLTDDFVADEERWTVRL